MALTRYAVVLAMLLSGCSSITAEESAKQIKVCVDAGLTPTMIRSGWDGHVEQYICLPKNDGAPQ